MRREIEAVSIWMPRSRRCRQRDRFPSRLTMTSSWDCQSQKGEKQWFTSRNRFLDRRAIGLFQSRGHNLPTVRATA
jgi:hypothetical protein